MWFIGVVPGDQGLQGGTDPDHRKQQDGAINGEIDSHSICCCCHRLYRLLEASFMQASRPQGTSMSPCDVAALQKCLKENNGDHKKVRPKIHISAPLSLA